MPRLTDVILIKNSFWKVSMQTNNISDINFSAIPRARYDASLKSAHGKPKVSLEVVELEKKDKKLIDYLLQHSDSFEAKGNTTLDKERNLIFKQALADIQELFQQMYSFPKKYTKKTQIFLGVVNKEPCGLLVTNTPKVNQQGEILYSARGKKHEAEVDWLVTWPLKSGEYVQNEGKALLEHFFDSTKAKKYKSIFVRSAPPEKSLATIFYQKMGFRQAGERALWNAAGNSQELVKGNYQEVDNDYIIPMEIDIYHAKKKASEISRKLKKKTLPPISTPIERLVNFPQSAT